MKHRKLSQWTLRLIILMSISVIRTECWHQSGELEKYITLQMDRLSSTNLRKWKIISCRISEFHWLSKLWQLMLPSSGGLTIWVTYYSFQARKQDHPTSVRGITSRCSTNTSATQFYQALFWHLNNGKQNFKMTCGKSSWEWHTKW